VSPAAVEVMELTVRFGDFTAVDRLSFAVERGEIFGFLGANGAGKTTAIRTLCGLLRPTHGSARVAGLGYEDGGRALKGRVGYMSQRFTLYDDLTVDENMSFAAGLRKLSPEVLARRTEELFEFIGLTAPRNTLVRHLAGGIKQELALAAAILHDPEILFLDEPTSGVSPVARIRFWKLIRNLTEKGKTVIVTTHYMDEAEQCGRIALMRSGRLIALDSPAELKERTFPEPLLELDAQGRDPDDFLNTLRRNPGVIDVQPYGSRHHVTVRSSSEEAVLSSVPAGMSLRRIPPSLEDVFLRLVEGKDR